jgi:hypothetical protein
MVAWKGLGTGVRAKLRVTHSLNAELSWCVELHGTEPYELRRRFCTPRENTSCAAVNAAIIRAFQGGW